MIYSIFGIVIYMFHSFIFLYVAKAKIGISGCNIDFSLIYIYIIQLPWLLFEYSVSHYVDDINTRVAYILMHSSTMILN